MVIARRGGVEFSVSMSIREDMFVQSGFYAVSISCVDIVVRVRMNVPRASIKIGNIHRGRSTGAPSRNLTPPRRD